jgi:putative peptidoglycan lipid II flippase
MKQNAVSVMYYSQRLYQLPFGVFSIALGTAIFPILARYAHHQDHAGLSSTLNRGLRMATFIALPCAVGMMIVARPLVRAYLEHGEFTAADSPDVAWMTVVYVSGLLSYTVLHLVTRAFYAYQEAMTPVKSAVVAAVANFLLNISLVWILGIQALALATVLTATGQALWLLYLLRKKVGPLGGRAYVRSLLKCLAATALMAAAAWAAMTYLPSLLSLPTEGLWSDITAMAFAVTAGGATYLLTARLMKMPELADVLSRKK